MSKLVLYLSICGVFSSPNLPKVVQTPPSVEYEPTWDSLDTRPLPSWFDEAKVGIFLHWGVFSVPSFGSEWFWADWKDSQKEFVDFMEANYPPNFTYQEFAKDFTAEFFKPDQWADLFQQSGAKYVVLTSKHHEGFTLWPSEFSFAWNARDIGPHRDLIGDLSKAVRDHQMKFGLYHSLYEWFNPIYLADKNSSFTRQNFVDVKLIPEMRELIEKYQPAVLWSDGDWEANDTYWRSTDFLAWLYNESPVKDTVVVNDRWGIGIPCKHGDFYSCKDRFNPGVLQQHKWENAMTIDRNSWGFRRNAVLKDYLTIEELITTLAQTISCGGNILINVGPTKDGMIAPIFQERLLDLGKWLNINGEAVYGSKPWQFQNDTLTSGVWYTAKGQNVFAIVLQWPSSQNILPLKSAVDLFKNSATKVEVLGNIGDLKWEVVNGTVNIQFPHKETVKSQWAWVLKITTKSK